MILANYDIEALMIVRIIKFCRTIKKECSNLSSGSAFLNALSGLFVAMHGILGDALRTPSFIHYSTRSRRTAAERMRAVSSIACQFIVRKGISYRQ